MKKILLSLMPCLLFNAFAWADVSHATLTAAKHRNHQQHVKHHAHRATKHHARHRHYRSV